MNLMNMGSEQLQGGKLNEMLQQVGISDVGSFLGQFRNQVNKETSGGAAKSPQADLMSMGSSFLGKMGGGGEKKQGGGSADLLSGAMSAYKMFSGDKGDKGAGDAAEKPSASGGAGGLFGGAMNAYKSLSGGKAGGGGNVLDNISSTMESAQQMQGLLKSLDKNGDGKITVDDIQVLLQGLGLGGVSPHVSKALFKLADRNGNGQLDLTDVMGLAAIVSKLNNKFGAGAAK